jgi:dTDP-glucose 4,6-dehydratase/UDP-glucuronate decarboxylase
MDANVNGLRILLERARELHENGQPVRGFLFFSSSEIYGDPEPDQIPTPETYPGRVSSTGPRACYDESKRYGETLCVNFARQYGLPVTMVRPFNNYGPGLKLSDRRVIPDFARDVLNRADLVVHSDGAPSGTFCYITDAVIGYYKVLTRGRAAEAYNIGQETPEATVKELAERMAGVGRELFGYTGRVVFTPSADPQYLTDNPQRRCPDIGKARRELGYAPAVSLDEGLYRSLLWYAEHQDGADK